MGDWHIIPFGFLIGYVVFSVHFIVPGIFSPHEFLKPLGIRDTPLQDPRFAFGGNLHLGYSGSNAKKITNSHLREVFLLLTMRNFNYRFRW